jgi:membrane protease subunit (stomatin/prohibitin family)
LIIGIAGYSYYEGNSISESEYQTKEMTGSLTQEDQDRYLASAVALPAFGLIGAIGVGLIVYGILGKGTKKQKNIPTIPQTPERPRHTDNMPEEGLPSTLRFCTHCGKQLESLANFCSSCGKKSVGSNQAKQCPNCKANEDAKSVYCSKCGHKF